MIDQKQKFIIPNWSKYQAKLKGKSRHRNWIAISTNLLHDPDFFRLTIEQRYTWLMLLCYAGAVGVESECGGVVFELSASDARVLFKLRRNADFEPFINQGFMRFHRNTVQTRQDKTDRTNNISSGKPDSSVVQQIFDHWQERMNRPKSKLTPARKDLIRRRLKTYTPDELIAAIDGHAHSGWHMGQNPEGKVFDGLNVTFKHDENIEKFIGYAENPPQKPMGEFERIQANLNG